MSLSVCLSIVPSSSSNIYGCFHPRCKRGGTPPLNCRIQSQWRNQPNEEPQGYVSGPSYWSLRRFDVVLNQGRAFKGMRHNCLKTSIARSALQSSRVRPTSIGTSALVSLAVSFIPDKNTNSTHPQIQTSGSIAAMYVRYGSFPHCPPASPSQRRFARLNLQGVTFLQGTSGRAGMRRSISTTCIAQSLMACICPIGGTPKDRDGSHVRYTLPQLFPLLRHALLPHPPEQTHARPNAYNILSLTVLRRIKSQM